MEHCSVFERLKQIRQQVRVAAGILNDRVYTGPWNVQIDLTNQCNNDCIACWCNSPLLGDKSMPEQIRRQYLPYKKVIDLIDELYRMGTREIYFTGGGEPFMHPKVVEIMRMIKKRDMHLDMSTNFTLVNKSMAKQIVDIGVDHMTLSLWSATADTYARQHPNKDGQTFERMTEIIDYIADLKDRYHTRRPALGMYNVINSYNYHEVDHMLEYAFSHKMDDVQFTPVDIIPERTESLALNADQRDALVRSVKNFSEKARVWEEKYKHRTHIIHLDTFIKRIENKGADSGDYDTELLCGLRACYAGWAFARVLATGDVNSCLKSFKIPIGNIHEKSLNQIWLGEKQNRFRQHTRHYDPLDPYFLSMGNDRSTDNQGCIKCCDNLGLNLSIQEKLSKLSPVGRTLISALGRFL
jgi:MoaA/NifB/PqqE/SkfB family radical SAM enzyme